MILKPCACPACGIPLEGEAHKVTAGEPGPGDFAICRGCAEGLVITPDLRVMLPTAADWARLQANAERHAIFRRVQQNRLDAICSAGVSGGKGGVA